MKEIESIDYLAFVSFIIWIGTIIFAITHW